MLSWMIEKEKLSKVFRNQPYLLIHELLASWVEHILLKRLYVVFWDTKRYNTPTLLDSNRKLENLQF